MVQINYKELGLVNTREMFREGHGRALCRAGLQF